MRREDEFTGTATVREVRKCAFCGEIKPILEVKPGSTGDGNWWCRDEAECVKRWMNAERAWQTFGPVLRRRLSS